MLQMEKMQSYKKGSTVKDTSESKEQADGGKKMECGVEISLIKSSNLCLKFQRDNCDLDHDHDAPNGNGKHKLAHVCAYCFLKAKPASSQSHSGRNCETRKADVFAKWGGKGSTPA